MDENPAQPLIVTTDPPLADELVRLAAAAGVVPEVVGDVGNALRAWSHASLVLVGADLADSVAAAGPARRAGVHLVTASSPSDRLYQAALACSAESVRCLPGDIDAVVADLADGGDGSRAAGVLVGVIGGAGGVGATVFAGALAETLAEESATLLIDADPIGPGIDRVLGTESLDGVRWDGLEQAAGRLSARSLYDALPRHGRLSVLTWSAARSDQTSASAMRSAMRSAISTGRRAYPVVVVDLARSPGPVVDDVLVRCDRVLLVSTLTVPAVSAAARLAGRLPATTGLVLRGSGAGVAAAEVAEILGLPVLVQMRDQRGLDEAIALGLGPLRSRRGPLARAARVIAAEVRR